MVNTVNKDILTQQRIAVSSEADLVVMQLGNVTVKLPYEVAFKLSAWLRFRAKESKQFAGDTSRHWNVIAQMHDAQYGPGHTKG